MVQLVLASHSPRRRELLSILGIEFTVSGADIDESVKAGEQPENYVNRLAVEKAKAVHDQLDDQGVWVLGSDTTVVADGEILGKPVDEGDFIRMMTLLSGRDHRVLTSVALLSDGRQFVDCVETRVRFMTLSANQIAAYWASGEPVDKAGGYGIQGLGSVFIEKIEGSYTAVVGLPLHETAKLLGQADIPVCHGQLKITSV
jgi:septum formation protein